MAAPIGLAVRAWGGMENATSVPPAIQERIGRRSPSLSVSAAHNHCKATDTSGAEPVFPRTVRMTFTYGALKEVSS